MRGICFVIVMVFSAESGTAASWEPFIAKVRQTHRTTVGSSVALKTFEHTYMRASNGNLRHEVRDLQGGSAAAITVSISDVLDRRTYQINVAHKTALFAPGFQDPQDMYTESSRTAGRTVQNYGGIPCIVLTSVFREDGKVVSQGTSCRGVGLGIAIHERATIPDKKTGGVLSWEFDLIDFQKNVEPLPALMTVPPDYKKIEIARPNIR